MAPRSARLGAALVATALFRPTSARASPEAFGPEPAKTMTLPEALDYARAHRPELGAALDRVAEATQQASATRARWLPSVAGTAQLVGATSNNTTGTYLSVPDFDDPRVSATLARSQSTAAMGLEPSSLLGVGVRQELFDFGRIAAQAAADDLGAQAARLDATSTELDLDYGVKEAYFAVRAAKAVLEAAQQAYARTLVHRDMARAGVDAGLRRPIELTRAEALLDRFDLDRTRARLGVTGAQLVFAASVGLPGRLLDAAGAAPPPADVPSLDAAIAQASARNPRIGAALAGSREREQQTRALQAGGRPNLYLTGALSGNAGGAAPSSGESPSGGGWAPVVPNWDVGVVAWWPLFDPTLSDRVESSRSAADAARSDAEAVRQDLLAAVGKAYIDFEAARDALPILERTLHAAIANSDQANARFDVGLGNAVELADAEDLRTSAQIQVAVGRFEVARARASLGRLLAEAP